MAETKLTTGKVRLSYANIWKPKAMAEGQEAKYSVSLLIPKSDTKTVNAIKSAIKAAAEEAQHTKFGGKIPANLKTPLRDGDDERSDDPSYAGHYFMNCSSKSKPIIVDRRREQITDENDVYSGCFAHVSVNFYAYNTSGNRGVACGLGNIQKVADGDALSGGRGNIESEFAVLDEDDDFLG
jgi:hypothetical protein